MINKITPWSFKFYLISWVIIIILSCSLTTLFLVYDLANDSLQLCGALDKWLESSHCLHRLEYSYYKVYVVKLTFSHNSQLLAAGGSGDNPKVWEVQSGRLQHDLKSIGLGYTTHLIFSANDKKLAIVQTYIDQTSLSVVNLEDETILFQSTDFLPVADIVFDVNDRLLFTTIRDKKFIELREASTNNLLQTFTVEGNQSINQVQFSTHGQKLYVISGGTTVNVYSWNVADYQPNPSLQIKAKNYSNWTLSPDESLLLAHHCIQEEKSSCIKNEVGLWRMSDGQLLRSTNMLGSFTSDLIFSADSSMIVVSNKSVFSLWYVQDDKLVDTGAQNGGRYVAISPDGKILATGLFDVTLWKVNHEP